VTITLNLLVGLDADTKAFLGGLVSQLSDAIASLSLHVDSAAQRVTADVADLKGKVGTLQATVDAGGASPGDLAALAALQAKLDQIDPSTVSVLPAPEPVVPQ
jgi:hypothetical protein